MHISRETTSEKNKTSKGLRDKETTSHFLESLNKNVPVSWPILFLPTIHPTSNGIFHELGASKIGQLDNGIPASRGSQQDIFGFQISMDNSDPVQKVQC